MKIIDFKRKGNVVRFYLGNDECEDYWGDSWDFAPYESGASKVCDEYVVGHKDVSFNFDDMVLEPSDGCRTLVYTKEDMKSRRVPCIIVVPKEIIGDLWEYNAFKYWDGADGIKKYYFGDRMEIE